MDSVSSVSFKNSLGTYEKCQYWHLLIEIAKVRVGSTHIDHDVLSESCIAATRCEL